MAELANCVQCDKIFVKGIHSLCPICYKEEQAQYDTVYQFVRRKENRDATIPEITEKTGVPEKKIYEFVRQGRFKSSQFTNLGYPCNGCGDLIKQGRICESCQLSLQNDLKQLEREEEFQKEKEKQTFFTNKKDKY